MHTLYGRQSLWVWEMCVMGYLLVQGRWSPEKTTCLPNNFSSSEGPSLSCFLSDWMTLFESSTFKLQSGSSQQWLRLFTRVAPGAQPRPWRCKIISWVELTVPTLPEVHVLRLYKWQAVYSSPQILVHGEWSLMDHQICQYWGTQGMDLHV